MTCYVNGELAGTNAYSGPMPGRNLLLIGRTAWPSSAAHGVADDVRIYNRALTLSEVMDLFIQGGGIVTTSTTTTSSTSSSSSLSTTTTIATSTTSSSSTTSPPDLVSDLVMHYTFDADGSNVVEDITGNGHTGVVFEAAWTPAGIHGGALAFDGIASRVASLDIEALVRGGQYSFSLWFESRDGRGPHNQYLYGTRNSSNGDNREYMLLLGELDAAPGIVEIGPIVAGVENNLYTWQFVSDGPTGWRHAVAIVDQAAGHTRFFLDGVESPHSPWPLDAQNLDQFENNFHLMLGALNQNGNPQALTFFDGVMDDFRIYARALTATEVGLLRDDVLTVSTTSSTSTTSSSSTLSSTSTSTSSSSTSTTQDTTSTTTSTSSTSSSTSTTAPLTVVPLAQALDQTALSWTVGGSVGWFGQTRVAHDGVDAARSGGIGHGQQSRMQTVLTGPTTLGFWWRLSAETNDTLAFTIGAEEQFRAGGVQTWRWEGFYIPSGVHTVRWTYAKNAAGTAGSDAAWVDKVAVGLFGEAQDTSGGWRFSDWMGYVYPTTDPWVYHAQHGWLYAFGTDPASVVFWDSEMVRYWWTADSSYPYMFRFGDNAWLWYLPGSDTPRVFLNTKTGVWEKW